MGQFAKEFGYKEEKGEVENLFVGAGSVKATFDEQNFIVEKNKKVNIGELPIKEDFGFSDIPTDFARGVVNTVNVWTVQAAGSALQQVGELSEKKDMSFTERVKNNFLRNIAEEYAGDGDFGLADAISTIWGVQKDLLLDATFDEESSKAVAEAGKSMIAANKKGLEYFDLTREDAKSTIAFDVGSGMTSIAASIGLLMFTKSPTMATALTSAVVEGQTYQQARQAGKNPEEAFKIGMADAAQTGLIEYMGGKFFLGAAKNSSFVKTTVKRILGQAAEESSQEAGQSAILNLTDVENKKIDEILFDVAYAGFIGGLSGAPVVSVSTYIENRAKQKGLSKEESEELSMLVIENQKEISDTFVQLINKEGSGLTNSDKIFKVAYDAHKKVLQDYESTTSLTPLQTPFQDIKQNPKQILEQVKKQLQDEENLTVSKIKAEQKKIQENISNNLQAEIDDLQINLLREIENIKNSGQALTEEQILNLNNAINILREKPDVNKKKKNIKSLSQFLRKEGGIKDEFGEVTAIGANSKLINNKSGMFLDEAARKATEAGYFEVEPDVVDFLDALGQDLKGARIYTADDLGVIPDILYFEDVLQSIEQYLSEDFNLGARITDIKKILSDAKKTHKEVKKAQKLIADKLSRLTKKQEDLAKKPPILLADKLKTYLAGLKKGKSIQKKETAAVQKAFIDILKDSNLEDADKVKFINQIKQLQTFEQFENQIELIEQRIAEIREATAKKRSKQKLKKVLSQKSTKAKKQSGKPIGKFTPEIQSFLDDLTSVAKLSSNEAKALLDNFSAENIYSAKDSIKLNVLAAISNADFVSARDIENLVDTISGIKKIGRFINKTELQKRFEAESELKFKAQKYIDDTKGNYKVIDESTLGARIKKTLKSGKAKAFDYLTYAWYDISDILFGGQPDVLKAIRIGKEIQDKKQYISEAIEKFEQAGLEAYGLTNRNELLKKFNEDSEIVVNDLFINAKGEEVRIQMTKAQIRKLYMEYLDPTLQKTLYSEKGNAYTDDILNRLFNQLSVYDFKFAKAQLKVYQELYKDINKVYRKLYSVNLPFNEFYSPIKREADTEIEIGEFLNELYTKPTATNNHLKSRTNNLNALKHESDTLIFMRYVNQMSTFVAFGEKLQTMNAILGDAGVRRRIEKLHGKEYLLFVDQFLQTVARGGVQNSDTLLSPLNGLNSSFAKAVLGAKLAMIPKQFSSFIAYIDEVPAKDFVAGVIDFTKNYKTAIKVLSETPLMKARGVSPELEIARLANDKTFQTLKAKSKFDEIIMTPIKIGDRGAIYVGGWAYYKYWRKQGLNHNDAILKFEEFTARTQQSADIDQVPLLSLSQAGPLGRTLGMFLSAPNAYFRAELRAVRRWRRGEISTYQMGRKVALYHFALPMLFQFVAGAFRTDEDALEDIARAGVLGPLSGYLVFGEVVSVAISNLVFDESFRPREFFIYAWVDDFLKGVEDATKASDFEEVMEAVKDISLSIGTTVGLPTDAIKGIEDAVKEMENDNEKKALYRALGWPQGVVKNIEND